MAEATNVRREKIQRVSFTSQTVGDLSDHFMFAYLIQ